MIVNNTNLRVRYGETDKMGYVYYGIFAEYYEVGRTELMREFGLTYKEIEKNGIMLPVVSMNIKYLKPAFYDDFLTIKTILEKVPSIKIEFKYEIYNQNNELLNLGETTLVFVDEKTRKPRKAPEDFILDLKRKINN
ncbi:MAG: acyl-CoA thioesterase [Bacteroidales bacterium]|nr:acyl-CoA thioesterase [Bacteroidales bacterium]MBN2756955.1 acyl-CoA thioesterase [Bacteroidales bacterium]